MEYVTKESALAAIEHVSSSNVRSRCAEAPDMLVNFTPHEQQACSHSLMRLRDENTSESDIFLLYPSSMREQDAQRAVSESVQSAKGACQDEYSVEDLGPLLLPYGILMVKPLDAEITW